MTRHLRPLALALAAALAPTLLVACAGSSTPAQAQLDGLTVSAGRLNPAFDPNVTEYSAIVPSGTLGVTVTPTASAAHASSISLSQDGGAPAVLASGAASAPLAVPARGQQSLVSISVSGPSGGASRTYTIQLVAADSADATLASIGLTVGTLSPAFDSATTHYTATLPNGTTSFKVTPTAAYANAKSITVVQDSGAATLVTNGSASQSLTAPALGAQTTITILVTAQNGYTTQAYTITVTQADNSDASLASLKSSAGTLTPSFASGIFGYALSVPTGTSTITLTPKANNTTVRSIILTQDGGAPATIANNAASAALPVPAVGTTSTISLTVTAQDGTSTATYTIALSVEASTDAALSSLALSAGALSPSFNASTFTYSASLPFGTSSLNLTPTAHASNTRSITITQDGGAPITVASGQASPALSVPAVGAQTAITVAVTAQDGTTHTTYTITASQAASTDSSLSALSLSAGALLPAFSSAVTTYSATVPSNNTSFTITPTASSAVARSITLSQDGGAPVAIASGATSAALVAPATAGVPTVLRLVVTAQSGATTTYQVSVARAATNDASLAALTTSAGPVSPAFASTSYAYAVVAPYGATSITVTPTATSPQVNSIVLTQDSSAPISVTSGAASAALAVPALGTTSHISIVVTAQDGTTTATYTIALTQHAADTDAVLSSLGVSAGTLTPAFASGTTSYSWSVPYGTASVTVTPAAHASDIRSITVQQDSGSAQTVASGSASAALTVPALNATSIITVVVTAQDGTTLGTYTISLSQALRNDALLSSLTDSAGALTGFNPSTLTYSYSIPFSNNPYSITATLDDALASLKINGVAAVNGQPTTVAVNPGANTITIAVTSADGTSTRSYVLTVTEASPGPGLVHARTVPVTTAPLATVPSGQTLPANNATNVPVDTLLRIGFDAAPTLGTSGTIKIYTAANALVDTINLADPYAIYNGSAKTLSNATSSMVNVIGGLTSGIDQVRVVNYVPIVISGNTAVIIPHNNKLAYNTQYYVTIDSGVLQGAINGNAFGGVTGPSAWTFTTKAAAPTTYNVNADNSADFATVQGAIDNVPVSSSTALTISIAPGVYQELLFVRNKKNLTFQGTNDGLATIIEFDNCDGFNPGTGGGYTLVTKGAGATIPATGVAGGGRSLLLFSSATGIVFDSITLFNTHAQGSAVIPTLAPTTITATTSPTFTAYTSSITQAETFYFNTTFSVSGTAPSQTGSAGTLIAKHSNFISYQDTIQVKGFTWFYDCFITGDTDFIWGNANVALFEHSEIKSRYNTNSASIVQSRAYMAWGATATPSTYNSSYLGFVFLNCALTKEPGAFNSYLARSPGAPTTSGTAPYLYLQYDIVSYINCSMDAQIPSAGWNTVGGNPTGANVVPSPVTGWREYKSVTPAGQLIDTSSRITGTTAPFGSIQLTDANVATFFKDRNTIFQGTTDGTYTSLGLAGFAPVP